MEKQKLTLEQSQKILERKKASLGLTKKVEGGRPPVTTSGWLKKALEESTKNVEANKKYRETHPEVTEENKIFPCKKYEVPDGLIPPLFRIKDLILDDKRVIQWCENYANWYLPNNEIKSPMFLGLPSKGKTHQMYAIIPKLYQVINGLNDLKYKANDWHYFKEPQIEAIRCGALIQNIQKGYDNHTSSDILDYYKNIDILMMDDIGRSKLSLDTKNIIYEILDTRIVNCRKTLFTSNFSLEEIAINFGEHTVSRMCAMCFPIKMSGKDWRTE